MDAFDGIAPILLSFSLYALYVLVPLVPSVVIYRLFPQTSVTISGPLSNLSMKATGAFAAYVVTVGLGWVLVSRTQDMILGMDAVTWTIRGDLELVDSSGTLIHHHDRDSLRRALEVTVAPPHARTTERAVIVKTTLTEEEPPTLTYTIPRFGGVDLTPSRENAIWNYARHEVVFRVPIKIQGAWSQPTPDGVGAVMRSPAGNGDQYMTPIR
jgi:hypothetical protein